MRGRRVVILRANPVQPDSRVEKEANSLLTSGYTVNIVGWDRNEKYSIRKESLKVRNGTIDIWRVGIKSSFGAGFKSNFLPLFKFQVQIFLWLIKNKDRYDIIHACDFDTAFTSFFVAKMTRKMFIYDIFDFYVDAFSVPSFLKHLIFNLDKFVIEHSDGVIICTDERKAQLNNIKVKKIAVIHNTPPMLSFSRRENSVRSDKLKIAYIGVLQEGRLLLELGDIVANDNRFELHIGGFGKFEKHFLELSKKNSNIFFYGRVSYDKTLEIESCCDILTAIYDPTIRNHVYAAPNKFYEALMLGKPLIMVKNTGMSSVINELNLGQLIEYSSDSLKDGIEKLFLLREEINQVSKIMQELYDNEYSWVEMESRLLRFYDELIKKRW